MPYKLSTIIINYNTPDLTIDAVKSVLDNYTIDHIEGEVIVIDNASSDDSVQLLKKEFGQTIQLIQNGENQGFAKANNQGIKKAKGEYFLLLNSDTVVQPGALNFMLDVFRRYPEDQNTENLRGEKGVIDRVGIVGPQLLNQDGTIQPHGGALPTIFNLTAWWMWFLPGRFPLLTDLKSYHSEFPSSFELERKVGWIGGAAFLFKREVYNEIGGLDENIFMYAEDTEYCLKAANHHWDVVMTPNARIIHFGSSSGSSEFSKIGEISGLLYLIGKHFSPIKVQFLQFMLWFGTVLRLILFGIILGDAKKKQTFQKILKLFQQKDEVGVSTSFK